jgi:HPt (histidine-containing phosphotransfer) domain-containing protein
VPAEVTALPAFDAADLAARLGGEKMFVPFLAMFGQVAPGYLEELREALARGDAQETAAKAHRLKGAAANISATRLSRLAADIEARAGHGDLIGSREVLGSLGVALEEFGAVSARYLGKDS